MIILVIKIKKKILKKKIFLKIIFKKKIFKKVIMINNLHYMIIASLKYSKFN